MIRLIAAIDRENGIAKHGIIPWKIPTDKQYFIEQTKKYGGICLIGRTTFLTFSRPLVDRQNFVLTHQSEVPAGVESVHNLANFLAEQSDVWVIGGASVFAQTIEQADQLYLTPIDANFGCNSFFPEYKTIFKRVSQSELQEENGFKFRFEVWTRK